MFEGGQDTPYTQDSDIERIKKSALDLIAEYPNRKLSSTSSIDAIPSIKKTESMP